MKPQLLAAVAAALLASTQMAAAQDATTIVAPEGFTAAESPATQAELMGTVVYSAAGAVIGEVTDIIAGNDPAQNAPTGTLTHVVLDVESVLGDDARYVAVPLEAFVLFRSADEVRLVLTANEEYLRTQPFYEAGNPATLGAVPG
ncbi:PRC-barrel domain-containing protein [Ketogulonicigenium vulgare]|nr:PRC-barrel domain-containing protein [Ketogulonicigenium vulgare]